MGSVLEGGATGSGALVGERRPTRVLVVVGNLDIGGVEMDIIRNFPRIDRDEFEISAYAFMGRGELDSQLRASGIELTIAGSPFPARGSAPRQEATVKTSIVAGMERLAPLRNLLHLVGGAKFLAQHIMPLAKHIRRKRIDVVHCFLPHAYVVGGLAAVLARGPQLVMSRVSSNFYMKERPIYRLAETRLLHRFVDAVICNSEAIRNDLLSEGVRQERIVKLYNGVDLAAFEPSPKRRLEARRKFGIANDELVFTCVANLHSYKGHSAMIAALGSVRHGLPCPWRLLCAGRDVDGRRMLLERAAEENDIAGKVHFLGSIDYVPDLLAASDIHVHPSYEEGLPNSILEAMASRLPIVATRVGGIPELVSDSEGGELVPPRDSAALAQELAKLAADRERREAMGRHNIARAQAQYSLDNSVRKYENLYRRLLRDRRKTD